MLGSCRVYEQDAVHEAVGYTIRPGGLALTGEALALCALPAGARVLDVGCGPGVTVEYLITQHHLDAFGLDASARLLQSGCHRNGHLPFVQAQGEHLPLGDGQLDAVIAECSLSVMADREQAIREFERVLKDGGWLMLSDVYARNPDGAAALRCLAFESCVRGALPQHEIAGQLSGHGFQIVAWQDHTDALKQFAAQLIWTHGSLARFWCLAAPTADPQATQQAITQARPGYFLLVAQKNRRGMWTIWNG
jgi:arsenite methyltransferase